MMGSEWYRLLDMPEEVTEKLKAIGQKAPCVVTEETKKAYLCRETAEKGFEKLQAEIGEDPDGMRQLFALLQMMEGTWQQYVKRDISKAIFAETMKFVPRFLRSLYAQTGEYRFEKGWWFWRELAMVEYRVGCLEYELVAENGRRFISLHIPSDADLRPEAIDASFGAFRDFLATFYPEWVGLCWECDSWMMSPALQQLLPPSSKIRAFQQRFEVLEENEDSLGVLEWVFPGHQAVSDALPENTSLQRSMKQWLLSGHKVGWTRAVLR